MNPASWWGQKVSDWLPKGKVVATASGEAGAVGAVVATKTERVAEPLDPALVRKVLKPLKAVADSTVSEVEGGRRARAFAQWYAAASAGDRRQACILMSERFAPDPLRIRQAREAYEAAVGSAEEGVAEIRLRKALYSDRTRLLQRFAVFPEGMRFLVNLRAELLPQLKNEKRLLALDAELENLFGTWFDVAFLELRRISWDSPASLVEKLIQYEAVHDIKSWADVKNRLDSDRRCYGFFHARLPDDPLIFVEVAFTGEIASTIVPLLDETAEAVDLNKATTAIFYSISNTQTGLKGISFGDSLIKRVVETLKADFPQLKTFATLSPIPGFRGWYRMRRDCCKSCPTSTAAPLAGSSASSRSRPSTFRPGWTKGPTPMPNVRGPGGCCIAPAVTWGMSWSRAVRWTRWRAFTWAMVRGLKTSTGWPTLRPRACSSPTGWW